MCRVGPNVPVGLRGLSDSASVPFRTFLRELLHPKVSETEKNPRFHRLPLHGDAAPRIG